MKLFTQFLLIGTLIHMGDLKKVRIFWKIIFRIQNLFLEILQIALFTNVECPAPYNDLVYDYKCSLVKNAEGVPLLHLSFKLKEDTSNVALHFKVRGKRENQPEETLLVFDLDVCEAISASCFFLKMIFDELRRVSNYPTECPFKKVIFWYVEFFLEFEYFFLILGSCL